MQELTDLSTYFSLNPSQLAGTILHCPKCGREHKTPFKVVQSGKDLISSVPKVLNSILEKKPELIGIIYDRHIEEKLERLFFEPFNNLGLAYERLPVGQRGKLLEASVKIGNKASEALPPNIDVLIGVGSGVISDLTKWVATKRGITFVLMGTAASMNAYTSITGTMTEDNVKTSRWLDPASAVLLDSGLLASAPVDMTCAGIGDLLARNVSNADWKLSEILRGTYFCPVPYQMMTSFQDAFMPLVEKLGQSESNAMEKLADAVLVSGYSMTILDGETSPSSGSEHIISHFFDFQHEVYGLPKNLHGAQVGIGTIIMSTAFEMLREMEPSDFNLDDIERRRLSQTALNLDHKRVFGDYGRSFDQVVAKKRIKDVDYRKYVERILADWENIWESVGPYLMPADDIRAAMEKAGGITKLSGVNRTPEEALQALLYGSHYRPRYTILDLFWELGLFPRLAMPILERSGVLD